MYNYVIMGQIQDFIGNYDGVQIEIKTEEEKHLFIRLFHPYLELRSGDNLMSIYEHNIKSFGIHNNGSVVYSRYPIKGNYKRFEEYFGSTNICWCDSITDFLKQSGLKNILYICSNPVCNI